MAMDAKERQKKFREKKKDDVQFTAKNKERKKQEYINRKNKMTHSQLKTRRLKNKGISKNYRTRQKQIKLQQKKEEQQQMNKNNSRTRISRAVSKANKKIANLEENFLAIKRRNWVLEKRLYRQSNRPNQTTSFTPDKRPTEQTPRSQTKLQLKDVSDHQYIRIKVNGPPLKYFPTTSIGLSGIINK